MVLVYAESGLYERAFDERVRSATLQPGNPYASLAAARLAVRLDKTGAADHWYEKSVKYEPQGAEVLSESAAFFARIGREDRAREVLHSFKQLGSPNEPRERRSSGPRFAERLFLRPRGPGGPL